MTDQEIRGESPNKHFWMSPNIIDAYGLDVYAFRLYQHYCWRINITRGGECWESTKTTAKLCGMSERQVREKRIELDELGLITLEVRKATAQSGKEFFDTTLITLTDIMAVNFAYGNNELTLEQAKVKIAKLRRGTAHGAGGVWHGVQEGTAHGAFKQEFPKQESKEQEGPTPSFDFLGDSSLPSETSSGTNKGPKTKGQIQKARSAAPISEGITTDPLVPTLAKVLQEELPPPPEWTDTHTYLYVTWLGKSPKKKLIVSAFDNADRIYRLLVKALPDTPLTPAIAHEFYVWYYSQEWVLKKQAENKMADTPQEAVPLPGVDKLPKHLGDWLASRYASAAPSTSYIPPQEDYRRKQARGGMTMFLGGGK